MKMNKIILFSLLLLKFNFSRAQKDSSANGEFERFYISLTGGLSLPIESFAKKEKDPNYSPGVIWPDSFNMAGPAGPGITGRLGANYFFSKQWGGIAMFYVNRFKTKDKTLRDILTYGLYNQREGREFAYEANPWFTYGYMMGLAVRFPSNKSTFILKILGGLQHSILPEINILLTYNPGGGFFETEEITQLSASSSDFVWTAGMEYTLKLSKSISVLCSADYNRSAIAEYSGKTLVEWKDYVYSNTGPYQFDFIYPYEHTRKISYISATAGIAYIFK